MNTYRDLAEISFSMYLQRCHCCCGHCKVAGEAQLDRWGGEKAAQILPFSDCRAVMETFRHWRDENGYTDIRLNFGEAECSDYPEICDKIRYARFLNRRADSLVMCNGMRIKPEDEQRRWLEDIRNAGAATICTTIFGIGEAHDAFAGRKGDFAHLALVNRLAAEVGLRRLHVVFFARSRAPYLEEIHRYFLDIGECFFQFRPFFGPVQNAVYQRERITRTEFEALPEFAKKCHLMPMRTLHGWQEHFEEAYLDPLERPMRAVIDFNINTMGAGAFRDDTVQQLIDEKVDAYRAEIARTVSMRELSRRYLDKTPDGELLYTFDDLETTWHLMYAAEHPEHGAMHQFHFEAAPLRR